MLAAISPADPTLVVAAARHWRGTPYHDQASLRGVGCDCLGLIRGVWRDIVGPEALPVPAYARDWGEAGQTEVLAEAAHKVLLPIPVAEAGPGAVVLFRMWSCAIAKHCGILTEHGRFIHAYERLGVIEEPLTTAWQRRIAFAFLFPGRAATITHGI